MSKSNIEITFDSMVHSIPEVISDKSVIDKYNYGIANRTFEKENLENILEILKEYTNPYKFDLDYKWYEGYGDKIGFILTENGDTYVIDIYANTLEILHEIIHKIKPYLILKEERGIIWKNYYSKGGNLSSKETYLTLKDFKDINEKYYPYLDVNVMLEQFLKGNENILILASEKGTAKSKFVSLIFKKILEDDIDFKDTENIFVASTKDNLVLANDEFWSNMKGYDFIVLDDLDFLLGSREESRGDTLKNQFLSNLLSFSDGIQKNKTKIIITTNQPYNDLDEALLRAGRLFAILAFRPLTWEEALEVWKSEGLDELIFEKEFKDDYIFPADLGSKINNIKRNKKLIDKKVWIKDPKIDVLNKIGRRAGLI